MEDYDDFEAAERRALRAVSLEAFAFLDALSVLFFEDCAGFGAPCEAVR